MTENRDDFAGLSKLIGRNPTYIQKFIKRGSPRDDIMADNRAATTGVRDCIYVIRLDDVLMVKRLASGPAERLSVLSDNPAYPG